MLFYAPKSGICLACGINFRHILRLLSHLCDSRRPKCRDWCLDPKNGIEPLPLDEIAKLDEADRVARSDAARSGRSHVLAVECAAKPNGRVVGRAIH